jgi:hypothetical protein
MNSTNLTYEVDIKYKDINTINIKEQVIKLTPFFNRGICMLKNKEGKNCPLRQTYLIDTIDKCVCEYHLNSNEKRIYNLVIFHKKFNKYIKNVFQYKNEKELFIENLKDILLLMIKNKNYKYTLVDYFNTVDLYVDNFNIKTDEEYTTLLDYYKLI